MELEVHLSEVKGLVMGELGDTEFLKNLSEEIFLI